MITYMTGHYTSPEPDDSLGESKMEKMISNKLQILIKKMRTTAFIVLEPAL